MIFLPHKFKGSLEMDQKWIPPSFLDNADPVQFRDRAVGYFPPPDQHNYFHFNRIFNNSGS